MNSDKTCKQRREQLGIALAVLAAGLGSSAATLASVESGYGMEGDALHYELWLTRIEAWSPAEREQHLALARCGKRF